MGIGQNQKLRNFRNSSFCSKSYWNLLVFVSVDFFGIFKSWITISITIWGKQNFWDFRVFDLGYWTKSKPPKSQKILFFLLNHIGTFQFFVQFIKKLLDTLKLSDITPFFEKLDPTNEANYRKVSILLLVSKKFEKIMYDKLDGFHKAIFPIPTFIKTVKRAWLRGVYWYNWFIGLVKNLWLLVSWFINGKIRSMWSWQW